ncbi:MAG: right-handed parallel beta-helix repeat-containing protein [Solirubrobacteraceae bacterium]
MTTILARRAGLLALGVLLAIAVPAHARTLPVPSDFPTVQGAVNAAAPGDVVRVAPGTYVEEVVIDKSIELRGTGADATSIKAPASLTPYATHLPDGRAVTAIVRVGNGARVRMSGLTVRGPIPCGIEVSGVNVFQAATLQLSDARVTGIQADPSSCSAQDAAGRAIVYGLPPHIVSGGIHGSTAYGRIAHVTVDHYQHAGISATGPASGEPSRVTITDDVIAGGWTLPSFQYGIDISAAAVVRIADNNIAGNICGGPFCGPDPIEQIQGAGIVIESAFPGTTVTNNRITSNDVGVYQIASPDCCEIAGNALTNNRFFGIVIQDGDGTTSGNSIRGGQIGIGVVADAVDTTGLLRGDRITGTSAAPIREIECCGFTATAIVKGR